MRAQAEMRSKDGLTWIYAEHAARREPALAVRGRVRVDITFHRRFNGSSPRRRRAAKQALS
jgi:hypothetical protein